MVIIVALIALIIALMGESLIIAQQEFRQRKTDSFYNKRKALAAEYTEELDALLEDEIDASGCINANKLKTAVKGDTKLVQKLLGVGVHISPDMLVGLVDHISITRNGEQPINVAHFVDKLMNLSGNSTASAVVDLKYDIVRNRHQIEAMETKIDQILAKAGNGISVSPP
jgi:hypothetical protein